MKNCRVCKKDKPLDEYYNHPSTLDGKFGACKCCEKARSNKYNNDNIDEARIKNAARKVSNRVRNRAKKKAENIEYKNKYPKKHNATRRVAWAIKKGDLVRGCCEVCFSDKNVHGHHDDYEKPLDVRWLCAIHHSKWHKENGEGRNAR